MKISHKMNSKETEYGYNEVPIPRHIRFWLLLCLDIPAVITTIFLLYHLLFKRTHRQALHNHVMIVVLFIALIREFLDVMPYIIYTHTGYVWWPTPFFCNLWSFVAIGLFDMVAMLLAWAAFERHILVFHSGLTNTTRKRFIFHYLPLILTTVYGVIFYFIIFFFPPCKTNYDYEEPWCGHQCFYSVRNLLLYDNIFHCIFPIFAIIILNILLVARYIRQKKRVNQAFEWRKYRKMIIQLLSVCILLLTFDLPIILVHFGQKFGLSGATVDLVQLYLYFFAYFIALLLPYFLLISTLDIWKRYLISTFKWMVHPFQTSNSVGPSQTRSQLIH